MSLPDLAAHRCEKLERRSLPRVHLQNRMECKLWLLSWLFRLKLLIEDFGDLDRISTRMWNVTAQPRVSSESLRDRVQFYNMLIPSFTALWNLGQQRRTWSLFVMWLWSRCWIVSAVRNCVGLYWVGSLSALSPARKGSTKYQCEPFFAIDAVTVTVTWCDMLWHVTCWYMLCCSMRSEVSKAHEPRDGFHPGTRWLSQDTDIQVYTESCYIHLLSSISIQWPSQDIWVNHAIYTYILYTIIYINLFIYMYICIYIYTVYTYTDDWRQRSDHFPWSHWILCNNPNGVSV